ncbi:MAG: chemotaxis family two-component system response regulator Rcp1 [Verrucomicrobiales bacterium]|jgi:chemotaxis family two-component system response regulator Rcp1
MEILLVEDNEADVVLMGEALREIKADVDLVVARSGEEGLERLSGEFPLPDIMILDLNLPGKHGTVVLQEMKEDARLRHIPVIVLSSSGDHRDVKAVYERNGNCFVRKPGEYDEFVEVMARLENFWMKTAFLVPRDE